MSYQHPNANNPYQPSNSYRPPQYTLPEDNNRIVDVRSARSNEGNSTLKTGVSTTLVTLSGLLGLALSIYSVVYFLNLAYQFNTNSEFVLHGAFLYILPHWVRAGVLLAYCLPAIAMGARYGKTTFILTLILVLPTIALAALPNDTLQDLLVHLPNSKL